MRDSFTDAVRELRDQLDALLAAPVLSDPANPRRFIADAAHLRIGAEKVISSVIRKARDDGASWQLIGDALGVSRQAAFQRYGRPIDPRTGEPMNTTPLPASAALATAVIGDLAQANWSRVTTRFDAAMRAALPEESLAAAWAQVSGQAGALESTGEPRLSRAADVTVTDTALNFEAGEFIARIAFRDDQSIAGLHILNPDVA